MLEYLMLQVGTPIAGRKFQDVVRDSVTPASRPS